MFTLERVCLNSMVTSPEAAYFASGMLVPCPSYSVIGGVFSRIIGLT